MKSGIGGLSLILPLDGVNRDDLDPYLTVDDLLWSHECHPLLIALAQ